MKKKLREVDEDSNCRESRSTQGEFMASRAKENRKMWFFKYIWH